MTPPLFPRRVDADLARRVVAHLTRRPLQRAELKARLGLPPRARRAVLAPERPLTTTRTNGVLPLTTPAPAGRRLNG